MNRSRRDDALETVETVYRPRPLTLITGALALAVSVALLLAGGTWHPLLGTWLPAAGLLWAGWAAYTWFDYLTLRSLVRVHITGENERD